MNYLKKVQLTADDLLKALPEKIRKGFLKEGSKIYTKQREPAAISKKTMGER